MHVFSLYSICISIFPWEKCDVILGKSKSISTHLYTKVAVIFQIFTSPCLSSSFFLHDKGCTLDQEWSENYFNGPHF